MHVSAGSMHANLMVCWFGHINNAWATSMGACSSTQWPAVDVHRRRQVKSTEPCPVLVSCLVHRAVAAALLAALQQLRSLSSKPSTACQSEARSGSVPTALEGGSTTARSYVSSFSFGSDAVVECWHTGGDLDVAGLTQLLVVVLKVLHKMQRWRCMLELGEGCVLAQLAAVPHAVYLVLHIAWLAIGPTT